MSSESLVLKYGEASAPLRRAASEEVVMCRFDGIGSALRITRIIVEYDDLRPRPEPVDSVNDIPTDGPAPGVVPNIDPFRGYAGQPPTDHLWKVRE
mgnify:CR=1 FL=1